MKYPPLKKPTNPGFYWLVEEGEIPHCRGRDRGRFARYVLCYKKPHYLPLSRHFNPAALKDKLPEAFAFTNKIGETYTIGRLERLWHAARDKAGLPPISLYNASRHSIASPEARTAGIELSKIGAALGHSSLTSTQRYASLDVLQLCDIVDGAQEGHKTKIANLNDLKNK